MACTFKLLPPVKPCEPGLYHRRLSTLHRIILSKQSYRKFSVPGKVDDREQVLQHILPLPEPELRAWFVKNRGSVTLEFMLWMTGREAAASGSEKASLDALGSRLTALREGLDPETAAELLSSLSPMGMLPAPAADAAGIESQIRQRTDQLALQLAKTATSPKELIAEQNRAQQFAEDLRERKADSTTEVIGRAPVETEQSLRGLDAATAADRILEVLLQIPDERERLAMVAEAFVPPDSDGTEESAEEELVHTSPMRLLQAVKLAQRRLQADPKAHENEYLLPGTPGMTSEELQEALRGIQGAIFAAWEPPKF